MLPASITLLYYELFREDVKCDWIYCCIFIRSNTRTCSNIMTKFIGQAQVATWTQRRFMTGSTVGGSSGNNLSILHGPPTASTWTHWATCYQCPNATSCHCCQLLCDPRKTCEHSSVIIQRLSTDPRAESTLFFPHEPLTFFQKADFFSMVCLRRVLLNWSAVLAIDNNIISHPAWVWIKSAPAFSMKSALGILAAESATG